MELSVRKPPYLIPSYSLTGDLLSFMRCGLQYRYNGIGHLPSTRPVQMWFGQFIHGVLEEAFRRYGASADGTIIARPELEEVMDLITRRLAANGLRPRNRDLETIGRDRARVAVHKLGPELFPIISEAEVPLNGTRPMLQKDWPKSLPRRESDRYEMAGIVDVITDVTLDDPSLQDNKIVAAVSKALPASLPSRFEVIVDYKGMRRPPMKDRTNAPDYWNIYEWQLQTYAQLRSVQADARPVVAGILIYLNELRPSKGDIDTLKRELRAGTTDVRPAKRSNDAQFLANDQQGVAPDLSFDYRLARALRVVPISPESQRVAARKFDGVVRDIEIAHARERQSPHILTEWPTNSSDNSTCVACDWKTVSPAHPGTQVSLPTESA
ncbi:PD-(D/E)XK nuclease family protein [Mycolicibacterium arenosum]|uniref:PD-(D/E)XK nuclease family protein n=1 Tax=Mycolicibacterium arenosum TaxID=2952157 RepID=A0ABT1M4H5_9MYCO|nr:PD-(D/E)XK nuclease family protein [Mycolicibacterium sp. CAU 1645]MCP9274053.1 PD-(D/E)XK nuclease family protein [Mycolicibacterium sp. CAU 1645]